MIKRIAALLLIAVMLAGSLPVSALADGGVYVGIGGKYFTGLDQTISVGGGTARLILNSYVYQLILENVHLSTFIKTAESGGTSCYAGIVFGKENDDRPFEIIIYGNCSIDAPEHGADKMYEGILANAGVRLRSGKLSINGVDIGIDASGPANNQGSVEIAGTKLSVNASYAAVVCDAFVSDAALIFNSTGPYGIYSRTSAIFYADKESVINVNPGGSYGTVAGLAANSFCKIYTNTTINVAHDASLYKGEGEQCAYGILADRLTVDYMNVKVNVGVWGGENCAAGGVNVNDLEVRTDENARLDTWLWFAGRHPASYALYAHKKFEFHADGEETISNAGKEDVAVRLPGDTVIEPRSLFAMTECADPVYGAVYAEGRYNTALKADDLRFPEGGACAPASSGKGLVITDAEGKPASQVVFSPRSYAFADIEDQLPSFRTAILWANDEGITCGFDAAHFGPTRYCTRAQTVTFIWRAMGSPEPESLVSPFDDIDRDSPYYKAILWAAEKGIALGCGDRAFCPEDSCTRAQVVTFLWRALGCEGSSYTESPFYDVPASSVYLPAILWAAEKEITLGNGYGYFEPDGICTRAHIVTFLYRSLVGEIKNVAIKSYYFAYGEKPEKHFENSIYLNSFNFYRAGMERQFPSANIHFIADVTTNLGTETKELVTTIYARGETENGEYAIPEEDWLRPIPSAVYNNKFAISCKENAAAARYIKIIDYETKAVVQWEEFLRTETASYPAEKACLAGRYLLTDKVTAVDMESGRSLFGNEISRHVQTVGEWKYVISTNRGDNGIINCCTVLRIDKALTGTPEVIFEGSCIDTNFDGNGYLVRTYGDDGIIVETHYDFPE